MSETTTPGNDAPGSNHGSEQPVRKFTADERLTFQEQCSLDAYLMTCQVTKSPLLRFLNDNQTWVVQCMVTLHMNGVRDLLTKYRDSRRISRSQHDLLTRMIRKYLPQIKEVYIGRTAPEGTFDKIEEPCIGAKWTQLYNAYYLYYTEIVAAIEQAMDLELYIQQEIEKLRSARQRGNVKFVSEFTVETDSPESN